jgi:hypothetical protein
MDLNVPFRRDGVKMRSGTLRANGESLRRRSKSHEKRDTATKHVSYIWCRRTSIAEVIALRMSV